MAGLTPIRNRTLRLALVCGLIITSCAGEESTPTTQHETTSETVVTSTTPSTLADDEPIAAKDARFEVTYTNDGPSYTGDRQIIEGSARFTFINDSDGGAVVGLFRYESGSSALAEELDFLEEGERGVPLGIPAEPYVEIELDESVDMEESVIEPGTHTWTQDLEPGTYIFDVGPEDFHDTGLWRAAVIEVAAAQG